MTTAQDRELRDWMDVWQADRLPPLPAESIAARVQRRTRTLELLAIAEALVGSVALAVVGYRAIVHPDPLEKLAMALLGAIAGGALAFSWWNWRGMWRASGTSTSAFLAFSRRRAQRWQRYLRAGWIVLAAEVTVFVPWIQHRLSMRAEAVGTGTAWFAWGFLALMIALAIAFLLVARRFVRRELNELAAIEREIAIDLSG